MRLPCTAIFAYLIFQGSNAFAAVYADQYWTDIEQLCVQYSPATHPPCNRSNGAKMILDEVQRNCTTDSQCLKRAVEICVQYSSATHPRCNSSNGLQTTLETIKEYENSYPKEKGRVVKFPKETIDIKKGEKQKGKVQYADQYWTDIEKLCVEYSGATHPPCNRSNGAKMILDDIQRNCTGNTICLKKAVDICLKYSGATHPACNAANGLKFTLKTISSYEAHEPKSGGVTHVPDDTIDIQKGEPKAAD